MATSFVDRLRRQRSHLIHRVTGTDSTGRRACYYVLVPPLKEPLFLHAVKAGGLDLAKYGEVVASCYGEEPTQEVKTLLKEKYGVEV